MSHIVSGKLRKAPFIKEGCGPQGDSTMFIIELAEVNKDWQTQEKSYTNYKAMFFAKTDAAKGYYHKAFAEGSFVVVQCEKLKVDVSECGQYIKLMLENARLEGALTVEDQGGMPQKPQQQGWGQPQQPQQPHQAPQQQQRAQQQQQQQQQPPMDYSDDIPF
jgi:transcription initiation factor TFIID subunit TAF12